MKKLYSIEARSYDLGRIASHNFWMLRDGEGERVAELHGLATDRKTNKFKPIGILKDRLGFYEFKSADNDPSFVFIRQQSISVFQADKEDVLTRWNKAASQVSLFNNKDINYSPFGIIGFPIINSNTAFQLFAQLMEVECCLFSGVFQPGIHNLIPSCLLELSEPKI